VPRAALAHNRNRRVARTANKEQIMGVQEIADTMKARVEASGFDRSVKFDTGSDGVIVIDGATISTTDAPTDCTIKLALEDLESLVSGDLNPTSAFMTGKIKVEGDMSVAMALSQLL
jgi:putative sterol carrier protein